MNTLAQFIKATSFSRISIPSKQALDAAIEHYAISDDLAADIYGYFLY